MKIVSAEIKNYRLLTDVTVNINNSTTTIVGKNNSGKTSFTSIFRKFLEKKPFEFHDFAIDSHTDFVTTFNEFMALKDEDDKTDIYDKIPKIKLKLTIQFSEDDNWANIRPFLTNLNEVDTFQIAFELGPKSSPNFFKELKALSPKSDDEVINAIEEIYSAHYEVRYWSVSENEANEPIDFNQVKNLIRVKFINAQRVLDDGGGDVAKSKLSGIFKSQFDAKHKENPETSAELFKTIQEAELNIDEKLRAFFQSFTDHFKEFGFPGLGQEQVGLESQLSPDKLFTNNVKLIYHQNGKKLPEKYNGLGYSNLIFIISQIVGFHDEVINEGNSINLIFIEEPEAHMHPQMQSVFIKTIQSFLQSRKFDPQSIITTHASHVLSDSRFENIRYFVRSKTKICSTIVKDLAEFELMQKDSNGEIKAEFKFLEQYITISKCDLFFADKAILFEGTVERILLPLFITKSAPKLKEQYVTSIEIGGTYMYLFKELLEFLELRTLVITDIDAIDPSASRSKINVEKGKDYETSNQTLIQWIPKKTLIDDLLSNSIEKEDSNVYVAYQIEVAINEKEQKCGRSFEEAFVIDNSNFLLNNKVHFKSISSKLTKWNSADDIIKNSFEIQDYIDKNSKKTDFAFELMTVESTIGWETPQYIKEGLLWLVK